MIKCMDRRYKRLAEITTREKEKRIEKNTEKANRRKHR